MNAVQEQLATKTAKSAGRSGGLSAEQAWGDYSGSGGGKLSAAVQAVLAKYGIQYTP